MFSANKGLILVMLTVILVGCSSAGNPAEPEIPDIDQSTPGMTGNAVSYEGNHYLWVYSEVSIDPETLEYEIIPERLASDHWNVINFLEVSPCSDCFGITGIAPSGTGTLLIDVELTHPYSIDNLTGFDVRGIAMFNGTHTFPEAWLIVPDASMGDGQVVNPDGYTTLYTPDTAGSGPGGLQGYIPGNLATPTTPDATLNAYKRFNSDYPSNTRNALYAGDIVTVQYEVDMPDSGWTFGYAVDASWAPAETLPIIDPMTDFGPEANCPEPYKLNYFLADIGAGMTIAGGTVKLSVFVYDWQGMDTHGVPVIECPGIFFGTKEMAFITEGDGFAQYDIYIENNVNAEPGDYWTLISVEDNDNATSPEWLDLTAYRILILTVHETDPVAIAACDKMSVLTDVDVNFMDDGSYDPDGGDLVTYEWDWENDGTFDETGTDVSHSWGTAGTYQVQLRVTDDESDTDTLDIPLEIKVVDNAGWVRTWGGEEPSDRAYPKCVAMDSDDNIYVGGYFTNVGDFDPTTGTDYRISNGYYDCYISKFDFAGNRVWTITFGGLDNCNMYGLDTDQMGNIYVTGSFYGDVDLDPDPYAVDTYTSVGLRDCYIASFDPSGNLLWSGAWGSAADDSSQAVAVDYNGYSCVTGYIRGTADLDPGPGDDTFITTNDAIFISRFSPSGSYEWGHGFGNAFSNRGDGCATDNQGAVYFTGNYDGTVDFDPGPGTAEFTSVATGDGFICKLNSTGEYQWTSSWGGTHYDSGRAVIVSESGSVYVTGNFINVVDFDPDPVDEDLWYSAFFAYCDVFVSRFDTNGNWDWTGCWGAHDDDYGYGLAVDDSDNVFIAGCFWDGTADFDPGAGTENVTTTGVAPDGFVNSLETDESFRWVQTWGTLTGEVLCNDVAIDSQGNIFVVGEFNDNVDFDPGPGIELITSYGGSDAFLIKLMPNGLWE